MDFFVTTAVVNDECFEVLKSQYMLLYYYLSFVTENINCMNKIVILPPGKWYFSEKLMETLLRDIFTRMDTTIDIVDTYNLINRKDLVDNLVEHTRKITSGGYWV